MGRDADGADGLHGPRQRRRIGIGAAGGYNAKGANDKDNASRSIDGVPVTDMGATGSSAFYYDFDSFQEMAVTTGGADAQNATGGVGCSTWCSRRG